MSDLARPGRELFPTEKEAQDFACARVRDMWIVHYHPDASGRWIVDWWCQ